MSATTPIQLLEHQIKTAREYGALFHPTNPVDAWFCKECCVFGRGEIECWVCGGSIEFQWVPRFGGGSQSFNPCLEVESNG